MQFDYNWVIVWMNHDHKLLQESDLTDTASSSYPSVFEATMLTPFLLLTSTKNEI